MNEWEAWLADAKRRGEAAMNTYHAQGWTTAEMLFWVPWVAWVDTVIRIGRSSR